MKDDVNRKLDALERPAGGAVPEPGAGAEPPAPAGGATPPAAAPGAGSTPAGAAPAGSTPAPEASPLSSAPSQQEVAIRAALETVMDPEIMLSVIDLGLIREIRIEPGNSLIRMLLTTPFCPYAPQLMAEVKQAAESVVPQPCEVEVLPDPWSPDMMPDPGLLGFSY